MEKGICHLAQIPLRAEARSGSEMVSQLLFGEAYTILNLEGDWYFIEMDYDGYKGWISATSYFPFLLRKSIVQGELFNLLTNDITSDPIITSLGSELLESNNSNTHNNTQNPVEIAKIFLGSPYLWGGRHFSGIDCSGLVQVVYKCLGKCLPRDASQQQQIGKPVPFANLFDGDLVFFHKNERITHVGLAINGDKIIHAHGQVRIDGLTKEGIVNADSGILTHVFHSAKRMR